MWNRRAASRVLAATILSPFVSAPADAASPYRLVTFANSPFPYAGKLPGSDQPFLDVQQNGRRGHTSPRGGVYFEDQTYSDRRVLLSLPPRTRLERAALVVFLHGNMARLERDIVGRQRILDQVRASGRDLVLVAPQLAVDALDSSAGHFWDDGGFAHFLDEAAEKLADCSGRPRDLFEHLPVVLVAYSGGYNPAAAILARGGASERIAGLILMDALYGEEQAFAAWRLATAKRTFFFSAYSSSSRPGNLALQAVLAAAGISCMQGLPDRLAPGVTTFLETGPLVHNDFMTHAWVDAPLRVVLSHLG